MASSKFAALAAAASSAMATSAWAQYGAYNHGYGPGMMWGDGWFGPLFGLFMMAVAFTIVVVVAVAAIRWLAGLGSHHAPPSTRPSALDILKERFARGEIDRDEFEERKRHLMD